MADAENQPAAAAAPDRGAGTPVLPAGAAPQWDLRLILALLALIGLGAVLVIQIMEYRFYAAAPSAWPSPAATAGPSTPAAK